MKHPQTCPGCSCQLVCLVPPFVLATAHFVPRFSSSGLTSPKPSPLSTRVTATNVPLGTDRDLLVTVVASDRLGPCDDHDDHYDEPRFPTPPRCHQLCSPNCSLQHQLNHPAPYLLDTPVIFIDLLISSPHLCNRSRRKPAYSPNSRYEMYYQRPLCFHNPPVLFLCSVQSLILQLEFASRFCARCPSYSVRTAGSQIIHPSEPEPGSLGHSYGYTGHPLLALRHE